MLEYAPQHKNNKVALANKPNVRGFIEIALYKDTELRCYQWYGAKNGRWWPISDKFRLRNSKASK